MLVRIAATVDRGAYRAQSLRALLRVVFSLDVSYLRAHPEIPRLYASGVRYAREPDPSCEDFATTPVVLARGWGDCDDLAPWRAAELVVRDGIAARPELVSVRPGLWHVVVRRDGGVEDPSRVLGMGVL